MAVETATSGAPGDPSEALDVLVIRIEDSSRGDTILSPTLKFRWVTDRSFAPILSKSASPSRPDHKELGPSPSISKVKPLWSAADDCYKFQHFESQWNHVVHSRILRAAFRHSSLIDFCSITGASIHKTYTRTETPSHFNRKVDFCVFVNVETPELRATALGSPFHSVNHTEYPALLHRPIPLLKNLYPPAKPDPTPIIAKESARGRPAKARASTAVPTGHGTQSSDFTKTPDARNRKFAALAALLQTAKH
ncbi:hypothetical protein LX36DRAFT_672297 [Colletotrichum falcatum]|nr:hypothetical protein LX36DRAFT_672297 [Colletotrichum falcatum]